MIRKIYDALITRIVMWTIKLLHPRENRKLFIRYVEMRLNLTERSEFEKWAEDEMLRQLSEEAQEDIENLKT